MPPGPDPVLAALDALVADPEPASDQPAASPPSADTPAEATPDAKDAPSEPAPTAEPTPEPDAETPDLDAFLGKLSPAKRAELIKRFDTDELFKLDERLSGRLGTLAQKQAKDLVAAEKKATQDAALAQTRNEAIKESDPYKALEALTGESAAQQKTAGDQAFQRAAKTFETLLADPRFGPMVASLKGKDYGELAQKAGVGEHAIGLTAATLFDIDMAQIVHEIPAKLAEWETSVRKDERSAAAKDAALREEIATELRPVIEKELRAKLGSEEPAPDTGSGRTASGTPSERELYRDLASGSDAYVRKNMRQAAELLGLRL